MPQKSLFSKLKSIVKRAGCCERFMTDLTEHDKKRLAESPPGTMFWWVAHSNGTHLFWTNSESTMIPLGSRMGREEFLDLRDVCRLYSGGTPSIAFHITVGEKGAGLVRPCEVFGNGWVSPFDLWSSFDGAPRNRVIAKLREDMRREKRRVAEFVRKHDRRAS